jgi:hypothetical protein
MVSNKRRFKRAQRDVKQKQLRKKEISVTSGYRYDILPEPVDDMDYEVWFW